MQHRPRNKPLRARCRPRPIAAVAVVVILGTLCLTAAGDDGADNVSDARQRLDKWVETRRVISGEKRDWELARQMLNERIGLVRYEIESLRGKINEARKSITDTDQKHAELEQENERFKQASAALANTASTLEGRVKALLKRLPDPLRERIKPLSQRLPEDPAQTGLSLSERFQNIVGILNEVTKFNREISVTSEVRTLPDGTAIEVTALYVGIGQGYYVAANGSIAGIGTATADGWAWKPDNQAAPQIALAIAILKNEQVATFVKLPVEID